MRLATQPEQDLQHNMNAVLLRRLLRWDTLKYRANAKNLRQNEDKVLVMLTLLIDATVGLVVVAFIVLALGHALDSVKAQ